MSIHFAFDPGKIKYNSNFEEQFNEDLIEQIIVVKSDFITKLTTLKDKQILLIKNDIRKNIDYDYIIFLEFFESPQTLHNVFKNHVINVIKYICNDCERYIFHMYNDIDKMQSYQLNQLQHNNNNAFEFLLKRKIPELKQDIVILKLINVFMSKYKMVFMHILYLLDQSKLLYYYTKLNLFPKLITEIYNKKINDLLLIHNYFDKIKNKQIQEQQQKEQQQQQQSSMKLKSFQNLFKLSQNTSNQLIDNPSTDLDSISNSSSDSNSNSDLDCNSDLEFDANTKSSPNTQNKSKSKKKLFSFKWKKNKNKKTKTKSLQNNCKTIVHPKLNKYPSPTYNPPVVPENNIIHQKEQNDYANMKFSLIQAQLSPRDQRNKMIPRLPISFILQSNIIQNIPSPIVTNNEVRVPPSALRARLPSPLIKSKSQVNNDKN